MSTQSAQYGVISFPNIVASLGGCAYVRFSARFAWVSLPGEAETVRIKRSALPPVDRWTAFSLADAAKAVKAGRRTAHEIDRLSFAPLPLGNH